MQEYICRNGKFYNSWQVIYHMLASAQLFIKKKSTAYCTEIFFPHNIQQVQGLKFGANVVFIRVSLCRRPK